MSNLALARRQEPRRIENGLVRTFDNRFGIWSVRVLPGQTYTTAENEMIVTILGSCVAACIRNPFTGFGGLNHFMLPESDSGDWNGVSAAMRYGNYAMEALINAVLKSGCPRNSLEIKLFGGSNLSQSGGQNVGQNNADFAMRYLRMEGLPIAATDFGGPVGRRIHYFPSTGMVKRLLMKPTSDIRLVEEERRYVTTLATVPVEGDVELFD